MLTKLTLISPKIQSAALLLVLGFTGVFSGKSLAQTSESTGSATQTSGGESSLTAKMVEKPQWEFGLAAAGLRVPAYPGSSVENQRGFLVPWFIYRGDKVRFQDGGLKVIALQNQRVTIDVSISGSLNADSDDTPLREGMPDLDYLLELGPKADVRLWEKEHEDDQRSRLNWSTALRLAVSTDFSSLASRGPVLGSRLNYRRQGMNGGATSFSATLQGLWMGEEMMDYIYAVDPQFVTPDRPAFDAKAGYLGSSLSFGVGHRFNKNVRGFIGVNFALHDGAKNIDSPLFETETNTGIYGGVTWRLKQSASTIKVFESN